MKPHPAHRSRGSALVTVMIIALGLTLVMTGLLRYTIGERRYGRRAELRLEADHAAEAVAEYTVAQVRRRLGDLSDFGADRFRRDEPLVLPPADFWSGSNVLLAGPISTEFLVGNVRPVIDDVAGNDASLYYYDPANPLNAADPMKGHHVHRYDTTVLVRATTNPNGAGLAAPPASYVSQTLITRALPVFSYAVFYNMDLEVVPGTKMDVVGPVHTNGSLYVKGWATASERVRFFGPVTVAGHNRKPGGPLDAGVYANVKWPVQNGFGSEKTLYDVADFKNPGSILPIRMDQKDHRFESAVETPETVESFRAESLRRWNGGLLTPAHGIMRFDVSTVGDYVEDPTPTNGIDESVNDAHQLIEPPLPLPPSGYLRAVELQKLSRLCGLYIVVNPSAAVLTGRLPTGEPVSVPAGKYRAFLGGIEITLPGQRDYGANNAQSNPGANLAGPPVVTVRTNEMYDMRRADFNWRAARSVSNRLNPRVLDMIDIDLAALKLAVDASVNNRSTSTAYRTATPADGTSTSSVAWKSFIYNPAAKPEKNFVLTAAHRFGGGFDATKWNGGVYIESIGASTRKDSGVRLVNGRGRLASKASNGEGLTIATNDAVYLLGHYNADGFIINAGGAGGIPLRGDSMIDPDLVDPNDPDADQEPETPCAVIGDALTLLGAPAFENNGSVVKQTSGWNDAFGLLRRGIPSKDVPVDWRSDIRASEDGDGAPIDADTPFTPLLPYRVPYSKASGTYGVATGTGAIGRTTKFGASGDGTEISAAFLVGIVPSNKDGNGQQSGSLSCFVRYIDPTGILAIRGSLVAFFESRVATEPWSLRAYSAPSVRLVGQHRYFSAGRFPPFTPAVVGYRRGPFRRLTPAEYAAAKSSIGSW